MGGELTAVASARGQLEAGGKQKRSPRPASARGGRQPVSAGVSKPKAAVVRPLPAIEVDDESQLY